MTEIQCAEIRQNNGHPEDIREGRDDAINEPIHLTEGNGVPQNSSRQECPSDPTISLGTETLTNNQSKYDDETGRNQNSPQKRNITDESESDVKKLKRSCQSLHAINSLGTEQYSEVTNDNHSSGLKEKNGKKCTSEYTPGSFEISLTTTETLPDEDTFIFKAPVTDPLLNKTKLKETNKLPEDRSLNGHYRKRASHSESDKANVQPKYILLPSGTSLSQNDLTELRKSLPSNVDSPNSKIFLLQCEPSQSNNSTKPRNSTRYTIENFPDTLKLLQSCTTRTLNGENSSSQTSNQNELSNETPPESSNSDNVRLISAEIESNNSVQLFIKTLRGYIDQVIDPCNLLKGINKTITSAFPATSTSEDKGKSSVEQTETCYKLVTLSFLLAGFSLDLISGAWSLLDVDPMLTSVLCRDEPETHMLMQSLGQLCGIRDNLERELHIIIRNYIVSNSSNATTSNTEISEERRSTESLLIRALGLFLSLNFETMKFNNEEGEQRGEDINSTEQNSLHADEILQQLQDLHLQPTVSKPITANGMISQYVQTSLTDLNNDTSDDTSPGDSPQYDDNIIISSTLQPKIDDLEVASLLIDEKQNGNCNNSELCSLETTTLLKDDVTEESNVKNTPESNVFPGASSSKYLGCKKNNFSLLHSRRDLAGSPTHSSDSDCSQLTEVISIPSTCNSYEASSDDREYYSVQTSSGSSCKSLRDQEYLARMDMLSLITDYEEPTSLLPKAGTTQSDSGSRKRKGFLRGKLRKFLGSRFFNKNGS